MADVPTDNNAAIGRQLRERFETYLLGLIFTLLALSIQTARFGVSPIADLLELLGWILLLVSGLSGLSRSEWLPVLYFYAHERNKRHLTVQEVRKAIWYGTREVIDESFEQLTPADEYAKGVEQAAAGFDA